MNKKEFMAMSLPYELKLQFKEREEKYCRKQVIGTLGGIYSDGTIVCHDTVNAFPAKFKLILRPLSDLTKEIEHNGEKFIPALELIKLEEKYNNWKDIAPTIPYDIKIINKPFGKVLKVSKVEHWVIYLSLNEMERAKYYIVSQLIKWKFDIANLIPKGEAIDVNILEINPYK